MITAKSTLDTLRKLEALLIVKQKVKEVDEVTIENDSTPEHVEFKEGALGKVEKKMKVAEVSFEGMTPGKYLKIHANKIIDKRTAGSGAGMYKYDPKTRMVRRINKS